MIFTRLWIVILAFQCAFFPAVKATSIPSFPNMVCGSTISGSGTCTAYNGYCFYTCIPDNKPSFAEADSTFTFGPIGERTCATGTTSGRAVVNETFTDMSPTGVNPRQPQGISGKNTYGYGLGRSYCIISCDGTSLNYELCPQSGAPKAWVTPEQSRGMFLVGAAMLWLGGQF